MATASNAVYYLVSTLFDLYVCVILLRIILQLVRADFYNPISQLIVQLTQPLLRPTQTLIPKWRNVDVAACALAYLVALIEIHVIAGILSRHVAFELSLVLAVFKLASLILTLYTISLLVQAILSWVGPGVNNPVGNVLWVINEPLLKPVRRVIPPVSGLDLSPLVLILAFQFVNLLIPLGIFR